MQFLDKSHTIMFLNLLLITNLLIVNCQYYEEDDGEGQDYTKYQGFAPLVHSESQDNGAGFVTPLDFTGLFSDGNFGLGLGSNVNNVFQPLNPNFGVSQPPNTNFIANPEFGASNRINQTGFISPSDSQALFGSHFTDFLNSKTQTPYYPIQPQSALKSSPLTSFEPSSEDFATESEEEVESTAITSTEALPYKSLAAKPQYYPQKPLGYKRTPYQKFSFQPTNSEPQRLRPDETERIPRKVCHKLDGDDPLKTCFLCRDAKSETTYEQCSYSSINPSEYTSATSYTSKKPSEYATTSSYRYKRSYNYEFGPLETAASENVPRSRGKKYRSRKSEDDDGDFSVPRYRSQPGEFNAAASYKAPTFEEFQTEANYDDPNEYSFDPILHHNDHSKKSNPTEEDGASSSKSSRTYDDPNYYSFDPIIESYAAEQSKQVKQDGGNCKKVQKDGGMTCMVCENPKTGGNFEQCSYTSEPAENKYAFTKETKFDSNDEEEPEHTDATEPKKTKRKLRDDCKNVQKKNLLCKVCRDRKTGAKSEQCSYNSAPDPKKYAYRKTKTYSGQPAESAEESELVPVFAASEDVENVKENDDGESTGPIGLDPELYGTPEKLHNEEKGEKDEKESDREAESSENDTEETGLNYEDYFAKIFPEYASLKEEADAEEEPEESVPADYFADGSKQQIEEVLADFAKKDRTNCTQKTKDRLTCFRCTDEHGIKQEECMYVTEQQPKVSSTVAVHQIAAYESKPQNSTESPPLKSKKKLKLQRSKRSATENRKEKEIEEPEKPKEFDVEGAEGAFASELRPVFSKKLGITLPAFMLTKSDHEESFDEVVASG